MIDPRSVVTAACLFAAACATTGESGSHRDRQNLPLRELQLHQEVFRAQYTGQHVFDFPEHGRVTVRSISLDGFPGNTYLRCRFHYQNRTSKPVMQSWVSLDVLDGEGRVVSTRSCHLVMPTSAAIDRGAYYSDELRTPTADAHLQPGWSWRIRCHADQQKPEEPLDPPLPEWKPYDSGPIIIKDWSWPYSRQWTWYEQAFWPSYGYQTRW